MKQLTDLEVCTRIAEIDGAKVTKVDWAFGYILLTDDKEKYNPLEDDALCFKLLKKYNVDLWRNLGMTQAMVAFNKPNPDNIKRVRHEDYNRAICIAIIEDNK